jgi:hypothetical protein
MFVPLRAPRIRAQVCVVHKAFSAMAEVFSRIGTVVQSSRSPPAEPNSPAGVSVKSTNTDEADVKSDLQKVRALAEARLKSGNVPDWSWPQHVQLIEAVDAMLHDISVSETPRPKRYSGAPLRLVTVNPAELDTRRKTGSMH